MKLVSGRVDVNEVKAVIRAHRQEVHHCYQKGLLEDNALQGELRVSFLIDGAGRAKDCKVEQHLKLQVVGNAVCGRLSTWRFPVPTKSPAAVTASWILAPLNADADATP